MPDPQPPSLEVCISFDIEFEVNGAMHHPDSRRPLGTPSVFRESGGRSHGLGFILDTLGESGLQGTFFTEVLNTHYFGDAPMAEVIAAIRGAGHDLQLHLHPLWRYFLDPDWKQRLKVAQPRDTFAGRDPAELDVILTDGLDCFRRLAGSDPVALRTGNLHADRTLYRTLEGHGIHLTSNIGLGIFTPPDRELHLYGGIQQFDGVTEVPVLSYRDLQLGSRDHLKLLTIVGCSWGEIRHLLDSAWRRQAGPVVILVHASDFSSQQGDGESPEYHPRLIAQKRFDRLCRYLAGHSERFEVVTFGQRQAQWQAQTRPHHPPLKVPLYHVARRLVENNILSS